MGEWVQTGCGLTLIFDLEVGGDEGRGLPSDPSGEGLSAFVGLVVFNHLDLYEEWGKKGHEIK